MVARRSELFQSILQALRERLTSGAYPADTRLGAAELAREFGLSPTPMREALARLCGEGLMEDRRGQGFFLRRLSNRDIAVLHHLGAAHLKIALEMSGRGPSDPGASPEDTGESADEILAAWVAAAGSRALSDSYARVRGQLARLRRVEPEVFDDLEAERGSLAAAGPADRAVQARTFFARRARRANVFADALDAAARRP